MKLAYIPKGEFWMGSHESASALAAAFHELAFYYSDELPRHRVTISKPFYIGVYEVTQAEYERIVGTNPSSFSSNGSERSKVVGQDAGSFPVDNVRWKDAVEFCRRLSAIPEEQMAGRVYRLPTEAEWEYASRGGSARSARYCFGDNSSELQRYGWFNEDSGGRTHPVGELAPNAFGLHDMHGNVGEWCNDWYGPYTKDPQLDPTGPNAGSQRVLRGGSWLKAASHCRSSKRQPAVNAAGDCGFRVVVDLDPAVGDKHPVGP